MPTGLDSQQLLEPESNLQTNVTDTFQTQI